LILKYSSYINFIGAVEYIPQQTILTDGRRCRWTGLSRRWHHYWKL